MRIFTTFLLSSAVVIAAAGWGHAQGVQAGSSVSGEDLFESSEYPVRERPRPDYDPLGAQLGAWILYPSITGTLEYDSNVKNAHSNEKSSMVALLQPRLSAQSDFGRHALNFELGADYRSVLDDQDSSTLSGFLNSQARVDVLGDLSVTIGTQLQSNQEDPGDTNAPGQAKEGVRHTLYGLDLGVTKGFNRVTLTASGSLRHYDYYDVDAIGGGKLDQDGRDGTTYSALGKIAYLLTPEYSAFVSVEGNWRDWSSKAATNRDSQGLEVLGGVEFALSRILLGSASVGYLSQDYSEKTLKDINSYSYALDLTWMPSPVATVKVGGRRSIGESTTAGSSGKISSLLTASVDYEVRRNLIITPDVSFTLEEYKGTSREDKITAAGIKADYLINRTFKVGAEYRYSQRESDAANSDYQKHVVGIYAKAEY